MERVWQSNYPKDVPFTIDPDQFASIDALFDHYVDRYQLLTAYTNFGTSLTYQELEEKSRHFASYLQQTLGLKQGDRVAIMMPNLLQYPIALFGVLRAGLVVVNLNPLYTGTEIQHLMQSSGAETIVLYANAAQTLEQVLPELSIKNIILTEIGDCLGGLKKPLINFIVRYIKRMVPSYRLPSAVRFNDVLTEGARLNYVKPSLNPDDMAFLQYTGGTTGRPRAAVLSHRNIVSNVLQCRAWIANDLDTNGNEVMLGALPMYHIFSLTVCCMTLMSFGGNCLMITNPRDMKRFLKTLSKNPVTIFIGLNTLLNGMMRHADFSKVDFSRLKLTVTGGMATQTSIAEEWRERTGVTVLQGYGLTEASPLVSINPLGLKEFNGSVGQPLPSTDIMLQDGELCVKGPQVMKGYWHEPEETARVLSEDGWLKTGDIAKIDEKGFIYIVDRKKDMIVVSGFNVYPNEIEEILAKHPGIQEAAVVGVKSEQTGEAVKAVIVKKDNSLNEDAVKTYCRQYLTSYKIPKQIEFRDSLPKSPVGKVLRRSL